MDMRKKKFKYSSIHKNYHVGHFAFTEQKIP